MADEQRPITVTVSNRPSLKASLGILAAIVVGALVVARFDDVIGLLGAVWTVLVPLFAGAALAYLVNLVMAFWERHYFPGSKRPVVTATRRPVCLVLALAVIVGVVALVVTLVQGEVREAFSALGKGVSSALEALAASGADVAGLASLLPDGFTSVEDIADQAFAYLGGTAGVVASAGRVGGTVAHFALDVVVAIVFALYVLIDKERVIGATQRLARLVLPERRYRQVEHAAITANECFSRFISGQCIEACILGCLCAIGLRIFGFPYAAAIGLCVGFSALIPLVGAFLGGAIGALMIMSVSPIQAVWFIVFLVVLQQIEGHLIYPNVVGTSVGVPSIWVLVAVFVGGSLFGIAGVLLGVPVVATVRRLVMEKTAKLEAAQEASSPDPASTRPLSS